MKVNLLEETGYRILYIDPPWDLKRGPLWGSGGRSRELPYKTLSIEQIKNIPVEKISYKNCHLYLWVVNKYISHSYEIIKKWGFHPSCLLTWCKPPHGIGLGGSFVQTTEHLLFCRKGKLKSKKRIDSTYFLHKRLSHSTKPNFFRDLIVQVSGDLPRIELFAREKIKGWDVWGNEVESDINFDIEKGLL